MTRLGCPSFSMRFNKCKNKVPHIVWLLCEMHLTHLFKVALLAGAFLRVLIMEDV